MAVELGTDQRTVLELIYEKFRPRGKWPTFDDIDRPVRRAGLDPMKVIQTIPKTLIRSFQAGRSWAVPTDAVRLTIEGIAACEGGSEDVDNFLRLLPWFAERELNFEPGPEAQARYLQVHSHEIKEFLALPEDSWDGLWRLHQILQEERWGWGGGGSQDDFAWYVVVSRDVARFAKVRTLADYLAAQAHWDEENHKLSIDFPLPITLPQPVRGTSEASATTDRPLIAPQAAGEPYVATSVSRSIEDKAAHSSWNCAKLLQLIKELNDNSTRRNTYSAHALLRAILDHIPPILDWPNFEAVANNHQWSRTDKGYMRKLLDFRLQGDDVLHRQISQKPDLLGMDDMPPRAWVNRLLQECADRL